MYTTCFNTYTAHALPFTRALHTKMYCTFPTSVSKYAVYVHVYAYVHVMYPYMLIYMDMHM